MTLRTFPKELRRRENRLTSVSALRVGVFAGLAFVVAFLGAPYSASASPSATRPAAHLHAAALSYHPWIEGVDPALENRVFYATYGALDSHNVLKVYVFSAGGYESAGIRFSARVPHESRDLTLPEMSHEAVVLIRATFDGFPQIQQLDVWATIPVAPSQQTSVESTVFSVSADRATYETIAGRADVTDIGFLGAFGRIWVAPQVPR